MLKGVGFRLKGMEDYPDSGYGDLAKALSMPAAVPAVPVPSVNRPAQLI
jgi:hypothetical protein